MLFVVVFFSCITEIHDQLLTHKLPEGRDLWRKKDVNFGAVAFQCFHMDHFQECTPTAPAHNTHTIFFFLSLTHTHDAQWQGNPLSVCCIFNVETIMICTCIYTTQKYSKCIKFCVQVGPPRVCTCTCTCTCTCMCMHLYPKHARHAPCVLLKHWWIYVHGTRTLHKACVHAEHTLNPDEWGGIRLN